MSTVGARGRDLRSKHLVLSLLTDCGGPACVPSLPTVMAFNCEPEEVLSSLKCFCQAILPQQPEMKL